MRPVITAYLAALLAMLLLDGLWLGVLAREFYFKALGPLVADPMNLWAAGAFYLIYAAGIVALVIRPVRQAGGFTGRALGRGALFGFVAYATYDLTNLATLKGFPLSVALVDMGWGAVVTALAAAAGFAAESRVRPI